jgi:ketosteroid isomerase-like protein
LHGPETRRRVPRICVNRSLETGETAMSTANVALVKSLYDAFKRGDIAPIIAALAPNVDWRVNGRPKDYPCFGVWTGPGDVRKFFGLVAENEQASDFSPREFLAAGDKVFVSGHYAWKILKTGRAVDSDWVHVFTLEDGRVAAFREFTDTAQFAEAYRG